MLFGEGMREIYKEFRRGNFHTARKREINSANIVTRKQLV